MVQDSVETWRLYSAEASVRITTPPFADVEAARQYLADVQTSTWWRWNVRDTISVTLDDVGNDVGDQVNSYSQPHDDPPTSWTISMHPQQLDEYHLLHEVAHCIAPRWRFGGPTEGSAVPSHVELSFHGPHFASVRLMLTEQFASAAEAADLREAVDHFKVATMPWADVLASMEETHRAEADLDQVRQRNPRGYAFARALLRQGRALSPADLGRTLLVARFGARLDGASRRPSQRQMADLVSAVVACTARDISAVERLETAPLTRRHYQVALWMAVVLNLDPVQAQYQLGLNREDDWDVAVEQLALLNPAWVELVAELDDLIRKRPPRWYA